MTLEEQMKRNELVVDVLADISSAIAGVHQLKEMDGRSDQGRYTAILLTELEKVDAIAAVFLDIRE